VPARWCATSCRGHHAANSGLRRVNRAILRDSSAVLAWIRKGGYVSRDTQKQKELFGEPPTLEDAVARYCRDKRLVKSTAS
jgi:hypothetical protein